VYRVALDKERKASIIASLSWTEQPEYFLKMGVWRGPLGSALLLAHEVSFLQGQFRIVASDNKASMHVFELSLVELSGTTSHEPREARSVLPPLCQDLPAPIRQIAVNPAGTRLVAVTDQNIVALFDL
jgi:hypothetical protein